MSEWQWSTGDRVWFNDAQEVMTEDARRRLAGLPGEGDMSTCRLCGERLSFAEVGEYLDGRPTYAWSTTPVATYESIRCLKNDHLVGPWHVRAEES